MSLFKIKEISFDCDDVLSDFAERAFDRLEVLSQKKYQISDFKTWDWIAELPEEHRQLLFQAMDTQHFVSEMKIRPEVLDFLAQCPGHLQKTVVTSPRDTSPFWQYERSKWLKEKLKFTKDQIIQTSAKHLVHTDVFVDDSPENILNWHEYWHNQGKRTHFAILLTHPNTTETSKDFYPITDWKHLKINNFIKNGFPPISGS